MISKYDNFLKEDTSNEKWVCIKYSNDQKNFESFGLSLMTEKSWYKYYNFFLQYENNVEDYDNGRDYINECLKIIKIDSTEFNILRKICDFDTYFNLTVDDRYEMWTFGEKLIDPIDVLVDEDFWDNY
jgi:hypothetical protein